MTAAELAAFREDIAACNERAADRLCRKVPRREQCEQCHRDLAEVPDWPFTFCHKCMGGEEESTRTDESVNPPAFSRSDTPHESFQRKVAVVLEGIRDTLCAKNLAYGDSALHPIRIVSKADAAEQLRVRIDDKLSRLKQGLPDQEDTVHDLIGYLVLLTIATHKEQ